MAVMAWVAPFGVAEHFDLRHGFYEMGSGIDRPDRPRS